MPAKPQARRARLADVARAAGVSSMTVARALRQPDKVAPETLKRVRAVLEETGYTPDLTARGLASQRSGLVAAIMVLAVIGFVIAFALLKPPQAPVKA